jgi:hypothetical protein
MSNDSFDQTVCTPEQLAHSGSSGFYCYTRRQNVGLVVRRTSTTVPTLHIDTFKLVSLAGFLSLVTVISMFGLILVVVPSPPTAIV